MGEMEFDFLPSLGKEATMTKYFYASIFKWVNAFMIGFFLELHADVPVHCFLFLRSNDLCQTIDCNLQ